MRGNKALYDTAIVVDYLNGVEKARKEIEQYGDHAVSILTWMELMAGAKNEATQQAFLSAFTIHPLTTAVAERAIEHRRDRRMSLYAGVLLATAEIESRILLTRSRPDFPQDHPSVRFPYQLQR